jgi:hypothetical protein
MPDEEAVRRAMDSNPHLMAMAKLLLADIRRNAPSMPTDEAELAQGIPAGYEVHTRAVKLQHERHLDYRAAARAVLSEDAQLKARYAGVQS